MAITLLEKPLQLGRGHGRVRLDLLVNLLRAAAALEPGLAGFAKGQPGPHLRVTDPDSGAAPR